MASYPLVELGPRSFNHNASKSAENELEELRESARQQIQERQKLSHQAQIAQQRGDEALAAKLRHDAKKAGDEADRLNEKASNFIFNENNAGDRVKSDEIDLHGQYVSEAVKILEIRLSAARQQGQTHLHVIVGKGNHSVDHVQHIKPAVEQYCQEHGLQYKTEANEGRIYIDLTGNQNLPAQYPAPGQYYGSGQNGYQTYQAQATGGYQLNDGITQQQEEEIIRGVLSCLKKCCTVM